MVVLGLPFESPIRQMALILKSPLPRVMEVQHLSLLTLLLTLLSIALILKLKVMAHDSKNLRFSADYGSESERLRPRILTAVRRSAVNWCRCFRKLLMQGTKLSIGAAVNCELPPLALHFLGRSISVSNSSSFLVLSFMVASVHHQSGCHYVSHLLRVPFLKMGVMLFLFLRWGLLLFCSFCCQCPSGY